MVSEESVDRVIALTATTKAVRYIPARKKALAAAIETASKEDRWLLAFCTWQCLFNTRSKKVDLERICLPPVAAANEVAFMDFVNFLRKHSNVRLSPSRVKPLIQLLSRCDLTHRDFYLSLLSKEWIDGMPVIELQALLPLQDFTAEKVYGELEFLRTSFSELKYPVALRRVSSKKLTPYLLVKEPQSSTLLTMGNGSEYSRAEKTDKVNLDLKLSNTPRFVVAGVYDSDMYYPTDYFGSWKECVDYLEGHSDITYSYRVRNGLNSFLERSMLVNSEATPSECADSEGAMFTAISKLAKEGITDILVSDYDSTRTGKSYRLTCRIAEGIIENVNQNSASLWFNGELINCSYDFEGKEQALLSCPDVLKDKIMEFYFVKIGNTEYCFGKGVCWNKPKWRAKRLRETGAWIDKCALCGSTKHKHSNRGVCKSCEANLHYYYDNYGVNQWITPSAQMCNKRYQAVWKHSILNLVGYKHKGTVLEAREDGSWRFTKSRGVNNAESETSGEE